MFLKVEMKEFDSSGNRSRCPNTEQKGAKPSRFKCHHMLHLFLATFLATFSAAYCATVSDAGSTLVTPLPSSIATGEQPTEENGSVQSQTVFPASSLSPNGFDSLSPPPSKFLPNGQLLLHKGVMAPPRSTIQPHHPPISPSSLDPPKSLVKSHSDGISRQPSSTASTPINFQIFQTSIQPTLSPSSAHTQNIISHTAQPLEMSKVNTGQGSTAVKWPTTTTTIPLIRQKTLPTPHSWAEVAQRTQFRTGDLSNQLLYPEWFGSFQEGEKLIEDGNRTEAAGDGLDKKGGRFESGAPLTQGEREEESPWREVSYFQNSDTPAFRQAVGSSNEDVPEREMMMAGEMPGKNSPGALPGREPRQPKGPPSLYAATSALDESAGLADVISRGRIDSVMYVYFGDKFNDYHKEQIAGRIIQAVGGVVAAIAHVLTVLGAAKSIRKGQLNILPVQLHIGFALLVSNLLMLLAVHGTEPLDVCASVAVVLHYLHLVIGAWLLAHTVQTYRALRHHVTPNLLGQDDAERRVQISPAYGQRTAIAASTLRYCAITWASPFPFILMSYLASPDGYETHRYCWMSIEKGMVVSFIVPVFLLIGLNTLLVILSLRHLLALRKVWEEPMSLEEEVLDEKAVSTGIRASAMLLPLLAISWFLGVVALENPTSIFFQVVAALGNIALSWLVMYFLGDEIWPDICSCLFVQHQSTTQSHLSSSIEESPENLSVQPSQSIQLSLEPDQSLDADPAEALPGPSTALRWPNKNRFNWTRPGGNEIYELSHDAISTIYK